MVELPHAHHVLIFGVLLSLGCFQYRTDVEPTMHASSAMQALASVQALAEAQRAGAVVLVKPAHGTLCLCSMPRLQ
jgi:hypothetical protein